MTPAGWAFRDSKIAAVVRDRVRIQAALRALTESLLPGLEEGWFFLDDDYRHG